jgi:hypothetical protein
MQVKFSMVEQTMRRAEDGTAMAQLVRAEARVLELEDENEALKRKNRVLADKLRLAEEAIRIKAKVTGTALPPGRASKARNVLGVPLSFVAGGGSSVGGAGSVAGSVGGAGGGGFANMPSTPRSAVASARRKGQRNRSVSRGSSRSPSVERKRSETPTRAEDRRDAAAAPFAHAAFGAASVGGAATPVAVSFSHGRPPLPGTPTGGASRPASAPVGHHRVLAAGDGGAEAFGAGPRHPGEQTDAVREAEAARAAAAELQALREQVAGLQRTLASAQAERDSARSQLAGVAPAAAGGAGPFSGSPGAPADASRHALALQHAAGSVTIPQADLAELERQLRDRTAQASLLRSRYEHLEAKGAAERSLYDRAVSALEEQNAELRRTRSALQVRAGCAVSACVHDELCAPRLQLSSLSCGCLVPPLCCLVTRCPAPSAGSPAGRGGGRRSAALAPVCGGRGGGRPAARQGGGSTPRGDPHRAGRCVSAAVGGPWHITGRHGSGLRIWAVCALRRHNFLPPGVFL